MRVLLVGFGCSPYHGSEPGTTWNWAWHLSAENEVWVIVHPQFREDVEDFLRKNTNPNLHVIFLKVADWLDPWDFKKSEKGTRLSYLLWQRAALKKAKELHRIHRFDVVHQVTMGTVGAPSPMWRLGIPFIWGSLGGGQIAPASFREYFGPSWRSEMIRTLRVRSLPFLPTLRQTVRHSAILLATNYETAALLTAAGGKDTRFFLDCGTLSSWLPAAVPFRSSKPYLNLLWSGRHEARKGLPLALEALAQVKDKSVRLVVTGQGPLQEEYKQLAHSLNIADQVQFKGLVPREELAQIFLDADAFLFTSLRDSSGSVVLEAMAQGQPVLVLDHHGVGAFVPKGAGIKVAVTTPSETISGLAAGIRQLKSESARHQMGEAGWRYAKEHTWDRRAKEVSGWYRECLSQRPGLSAPLVS